MNNKNINVGYIKLKAGHQRAGIKQRQAHFGSFDFRLTLQDIFLLEKMLRSKVSLSMFYGLNARLDLPLVTVNSDTRADPNSSLGTSNISETKNKSSKFS